MKKLFQRQKTPKAGVPTLADQQPLQQPEARTADDHWVVLQPQPPTNEYNTLPPGAAPLQTTPSPMQQVPSPRAQAHGHNQPNGQPQALHPHHAHHPSHTTAESHAHHQAELAGSVSAHSDGPAPALTPTPGKEPVKLQKKGFFGRDRDKDKDRHPREPERAHREPERERGPTGQPGELTRMIGAWPRFQIVELIP